MKKRLLVILSIVALALMCSLISGCSTNKVSIKDEPKEQNIYIVQSSPGNMLEQLKNKEIDGFVSWEPFNATAVVGGMGVI